MPDGDRLAFVIPRHAVPVGAGGLSPLQERMLDAPEPIRIFSAPTGAGKSYAFQVAMRERQARILFIVPTRRLAQNLAEGLRADLVSAGLSDEDVLGKVFLWTSDETRRVRDGDPAADVNRMRIRHVRLDADHRGGIMIITTPESVARYLLRPSFSKGGADVQSIADLLRLDHVVFDEFHTIEARGMGLSMSIATYLHQGISDAKLTFLSATAVDLAASLVHFGIPRDAILVESETVISGTQAETPGMRAIHGDVHVSFLRATSMVGALERNRDAVLEILSRPPESRGGQVVLIFDSVRDLQTSKKDLARWFSANGVDRDSRLAINSIDDSTDADLSGSFIVGRTADPLRYRVLVATASVEMGVTFRAGMILMNPGHDPCSFVQRIGRVARGDIDGRVIVTTSRAEREDPSWFKQMRAHLAKEGSVVPVDRFVGCVLAGVRASFAVTETDLDQLDGTFRRMPQSAAWAAALFWSAMEEAMLEAGHKGTRGLLRNFRPRKAAAMSAWLAELKETGLHSAITWRSAFLAEALRLRMIAPSVRLVDPDGKWRTIPWHIWAADEALSREPMRLLPDGGVEVSIQVSVEAALSALGYDRHVDRMEEVLLPHCAERPLLKADRLADTVLGRMRQDGRTHMRETQRKALELGERLIRLTRIVPTVEATPDAGDSTAIL